MEDIRFYPLIRVSTDAADYQPMTPTVNERTVREHHSFWLMEIVRNYYRLCAAERPSADTVKEMTARCPKCGGVLRSITTVTDEHPFPLYVCGDCSPGR